MWMLYISRPFVFVHYLLTCSYIKVFTLIYMPEAKKSQAVVGNKDWENNLQETQVQQQQQHRFIVVGITGKEL